MLSSQRHLFDIPKDIVYLNTAYMSPLLNSVVRAIDVGTRLKAQPWKLTISNFYDDINKARALFANIVSSSASSVAIIPSASYGIETAAKNLSLSPLKSIVLLENQFPSHVYPWRRLAKKNNGHIKTIPANGKEPLTSSILNSIDEKCEIVALPNVLWTTGQIIDLEKVRQKCDLVNAALVLDLTQSAGAMAIDFNKIRPDFAVVANYKWMLGPYSTGFLYVDPKHHNGEPLEEGWVIRKDSRNFSNLIRYTDEYEPGAIRYDMGERANFALLPGVISALEQLNAWGVNNIEHTLKNRNLSLVEKLANLGLNVVDSQNRAPHFLSIKLPKNVNPNLLKILEEKSIYISERANSLRITPHLWNNDEDFDYFISELSSIL